MDVEASKKMTQAQKKAFIENALRQPARPALFASMPGIVRPADILRSLPKDRKMSGIERAERYWDRKDRKNGDYSL